MRFAKDGNATQIIITVSHGTVDSIFKSFLNNTPDRGGSGTNCMTQGGVGWDGCLIIGSLN